jgi:hypothetical protein
MPQFASGRRSAKLKTSLLRYAVAACAVAAVGVACSPRVIVESAPATTARSTEIKVQVTASVLITRTQEQPTRQIESIEIFPRLIVVDPAESVQLSAVAFGTGGEAIPDVEFVWSSGDSLAGSIAKDGRFQAGAAPGVFDNSILVTGIQNTLEGIRYASAFASITVVGESQPLRLADVVIIPESPALFKQQLYQMRAMGFDENGLVIPGVSFVWRLNDPRLGRLNDIGLLTVEGGEGSYPDAITVVGIWGGDRSSAVTGVSVIDALEADDFLSVHALPQRFFLDPGDRLRLRAVALNGLGEIVSGAVPRWIMMDAGAGSVDGDGNYVAGEVPGVYTNAVRVEVAIPGERGFVRAFDFASVVIRRDQPSGRLSALFVEPQTAVVSPGGMAAFTIKAMDEAGGTAINLAISWEVTNTDVGVIGLHGEFRAGSSPGNFQGALRVRVEQQLGDESITMAKTANVVITGTIARAEVHPDVAIIAPERTAHFSLTGWDENGFELPGLVVVWSVSDESVGTIDPFGNFTAGRVTGLFEDAVRAEVIQRISDPR